MASEISCNAGVPYGTDSMLFQGQVLQVQALHIILVVQIQFRNYAVWRIIPMIYVWMETGSHTREIFDNTWGTRLISSHHGHIIPP